jgi:Dimerisation domain
MATGNIGQPRSKFATSANNVKNRQLSENSLTVRSPDTAARSTVEKKAREPALDAKAQPHDRAPGLGRPVSGDGNQKTDAYHEMMQMILSFWVSQTIRTTAELSIADHLAAGGLTSVEIAAREGTTVEATFRLLKIGVGFGLMRAGPDGRFYATELLATLRRDAPRSLRQIALSFTDPELWQQSLHGRHH